MREWRRWGGGGLFFSASVTTRSEGISLAASLLISEAALRTRCQLFFSGGGGSGSGSSKSSFSSRYNSAWRRRVRGQAAGAKHRKVQRHGWGTARDGGGKG